VLSTGANLPQYVLRMCIFYGSVEVNVFKYLALTTDIFFVRMLVLTVTLFWYLSSGILVELYRRFRGIVIFIVTPKISLYPKHVYVKNALLLSVYVIRYLFMLRE
jgi:hypothetical protein